MTEEEQFTEAARRSVERFKGEYSDNEFWDVLQSLHAKEMTVRPNLHRFYNLAHVDWEDAKLFHGYWQKATDEVKSLNNMIECVARQLAGRGDPDIESWLAEREALLRDKQKEWVSLCYLTEEDKKPILPKLRLVHSR